MTLNIHRPYPGVALVVTPEGSVLMGAPADAFKATKLYCQENQLPFPRVLVAPQKLLVEANPQFAPEFFLYDFLFVYGAAFKPELAHERLQMVVDADQVDTELEALRMTLTGPTRQELLAYQDSDGNSLVDAADAKMLADVAEGMAIKKGDRPRTIEDSIEVVTFNRGGADLFGGHVQIERDGPTAFLVRCGRQKIEVDLTITTQVIPFATLPVPDQVQTPLTFGIKPIGVRNGFDLSGPTTGFVIWVNGRAVLYDGPVGSRYLLEQQGIPFSDVEAVILSHCHEDHMGAFVELILTGHKPKVMTAEPIYRSMLTKLASHFHLPEDQVTSFIDYQRVTPGQPISELGATFDFFYTVHTIPTIGVNVSVKNGKRTHSVQISGDTMHHEGLDRMKADGILTADRHKQMLNLVPQRKKKGSLFFADVGEAIIHGHPKDWQNNKNEVLYYHCPDNEHTRSFGKPLAELAATYTLIETPRIHPVTPARILSALSFLDFKDPAWLTQILFRGHSRTVKAGALLCSPDDEDCGRVFSIIVSGTASVLSNGNDTLAQLRPGEFFGAVELEDGKMGPAIRAETPMELFNVEADLFHDYVHSAGLEDAIERIWTQGPLLESAKLFRRLDASNRKQVARVGTEESFGKGESIIEQGSKADDFYLLAEGSVEVIRNGKTIGELKADAEDNFFGEISAVFPNRPRTATVKAKTGVRTLRVRGQQMRSLFEGDMGVRYALVLAIHDRESSHSS